MTTWIIAFNQNGNTSAIRLASNRQPDMSTAVELVTRKAEREYERIDLDPDMDDLPTPAQLLANRYGITITGIAQV